MRKRLCCIFSAFLIFISFTIPAFAESSSNIEKYIFIDSNGNTHQYFDSSGNPVTVEEAHQILYAAVTVETSNVLRGPIYPYPDTVYVSSIYTQNGTRQKVTPDVKGPATISYGQSVGVSSSISANFGIEINTRIFNAVAVKAGVSYSSSRQSNTNFGVTFSIPSGRIGAVYFTPYLIVGNAVYVDKNRKGYNVTAKYPKSAGSFADGLYEVITRRA